MKFLLIAASVAAFLSPTWAKSITDVNTEKSETIKKEENSQKELNMKFISAVAENNVNLVKELVKQGASVDTTDEYDFTPLLFAAYNGNTEIVQILIDHKADLNYGRYGTPLIIAANRGHINIVKLLIKAGADLNKKECVEEHTALMDAAGKGYKEIVQLLVEAGADVNAEGWNSNHTALKLAEKLDHTEIAKILKKAGAKK